MAFPIMAAALGLASFAPLIARWLEGSQAEDAASKAISIAQTITGAPDPLKAYHKLQNNPDMAAEFQKAIAQAEAELELATLKDRQHARMRDMSITNGKRSNTRADIMTAGASAALIFCLVFLAYSKSFPGEAIGVISTIAGVFGSCLKDAYAFEFGSSRGSKEKDDTVAALMEKHNL